MDNRQSVVLTFALVEGGGGPIGPPSEYSAVDDLVDTVMFYFHSVIQYYTSIEGAFRCIKIMRWLI